VAVIVWIAWFGCSTSPPSGPPPAETLPTPSAWVGSAACASCHPKESSEWAASWHSKTVRAADGDDIDKLHGLLECSDLDASHVLGGRHELRFLTEVSTNAWGAGRWLALPCGWDDAERGPTSHHPEDWQHRPWETECAGCHVTGFRGPTEAFAEPAVGCEACHGPGAEHARTGDKTKIVSFDNTDEIAVCGACHLQGARSKRTGLTVPDHFVPGRPLYDDWSFDWSTLDTASPIDAHQKETIRDHLQGSDVKCTSCHTLHTLDHTKHTTAPKSDLCFRCHESDFRLKEYQQSCAVCEF
jgi:predicted CXXCH cytochrome family protein